MAAFSLLAVSCQEEIAYTPGEQDLEGCYGVYFPTQEASGDHTMDPSETPAVDIVVKRATDEGDITVPVEVVASEEGIFNVPELKFVDGQTEATLSVTFPKAQPGVDYSLTLQITDPAYVSRYGANPTYITYSVVIEKYDLMGTALYREDLLSALFAVPNVEWEVEVYTKETTPGVYYLKNLYTSACPLNEPGDYVEEDVFFTVDASNPAKVFIPLQPLGFDWGYGMAWASSYVAPYFNIEDGFYGTLINGVITFPVEGLLFGMEGYNDRSFYFANPKGLSRIVLPGAVLVDYSMALTPGFSAEGKLPVAFTFGTDVATIKYAAYAGPLSKADLEEKTAELVAATDAKTVSKPAADAEGNVPDAVVEFSFDATGEYTLVAVACDAEGTPQNSTSVVVSYVAADDEVPVVVSAGLGSAAKYAPMGITSETAVEFYVYGEDLKDVKIGVYSLVDLASNQEGCIADLQQAPSVSAEVLAEINEGVYVDVVTKLLPGTEYYMLVYASNGYENKIIMTNAQTTDGDPKKIYTNYTVNDYVWDLAPKTSEGYFGTYNYYGVDYFTTKTGLREKLGQVTISDADIPDDEADENGLVAEYVLVDGLFAVSQEELAIKDGAMYFAFYGGVLYDLANSFGPVEYNGATYYTLTGGFVSGEGFYPGNSNLLVGAYVEEGYLAFCCNPNYADYGFDGLGLALFADEAFEEYAGGWQAVTNILLVDPEFDEENASASAAPSSADLARLNMSIKKGPANYVETRNGSMMSAIDRMWAEKAPKAVGTVAGVEGEWSASAAEFTSEEVASQFNKVTSDFKKVNDTNKPLYR